MRGVAAGSGAKAASRRFRARGLRWAAEHTSRLGQVRCLCPTIKVQGLRFKGLWFGESLVNSPYGHL